MIHRTPDTSWQHALEYTVVDGGVVEDLPGILRSIETLVGIQSRCFASSGKM